MFRKIPGTKNPPKDKPVLLWDGSCGFCKYWYLNLKSRIGDKIDYEPYQDAHDRFEEIPYGEFKRASRLIEKDGTVYSGPDSLYRSMIYMEKPVYFWHKWYVRNPVFKKLSDWGYDWISRHRPQLYKLTVLLWGKDPAHQKPYWIIWIGLLISVVVGAVLLW